MPRPGQIVPRAPEGSEHGATAALQRLAGAVRVPRETRALPVEIEDDLNDGYDEALFAGSARPDEPITAGAPFGPGPLALRRSLETDRAYMLRIADILERSSVSRELAAYIEAIRAGR